MTDIPMPLDFAVRRFFPHGGVTKAQMIAAIRRGHLRAEKIGRGYLVTPGAIREWRKLCHVGNSRQDCASESEKAANRDGSLSMEELKSIQAAALATMSRFASHLNPLKLMTDTTSKFTMRSRYAPLNSGQSRAKSGRGITPNHHGGGYTS